LYTAAAVSDPICVASILDWTMATSIRIRR
jgi:hypothetical protein